MPDILAAAIVAAVAGLACCGIIAFVERTAHKETDEPQCVLLDTPEGPLFVKPVPPVRDFEITVTRYIRTGEFVNISFTLPVPDSWNMLEQSDAWRQFRQALEEMQKGGPTP